MSGLSSCSLPAVSVVMKEDWPWWFRWNLVITGHFSNSFLRSLCLVQKACDAPRTVDTDGSGEKLSWKLSSELPPFPASMQLPPSVLYFLALKDSPRRRKKSASSHPHARFDAFPNNTLLRVIPTMAFQGIYSDCRIFCYWSYMFTIPQEKEQGYALIWHILSDILSSYLSGIPSAICSDLLSDIFWHSIWHSVWHSLWQSLACVPTELCSSRLRSGNHCDLELEVEAGMWLS